MDVDEGHTQRIFWWGLPWRTFRLAMTDVKRLSTSGWCASNFGWLLLCVVPVKLPDQHGMWLSWRLTLKLSLPHYRQWVSTWSMPGWSTAWHSLQCYRRIWLLLSLLLLNRDKVSFQVACFYWHILFRFGGSGEQTLLQTWLPASKTQVFQPLTCSCVVRIIWQGRSPNVLFMLQLRDLLQLNFLFLIKR